MTPFDAEDRLNLKAAGRLVARLIEQGAGGFYICGNSGEAPLLRIEERLALTEFVIKEVAGEVPVMVHVGQTAPPLAVELAQHAARCGADAISSTLPPFFNYTPGQIAGYWTSLTRGHDVPFYGYVLQDLGQSREQIFAWLDGIAGTPGLAGLKFTNADAYQLAMLKLWANGRLNILSGHDQGYLGCRVQGADGAIGTSYNIALPLWLRVSRLYESGDMAGATEAMLACCDVVGRLSNGHFLHMVKLLLARQGIDCGLPRPPLRADIEIDLRADARRGGGVD
jgi:N-acetylneuraminate lyase